MQLINAVDLFQKMKKSLGNKRNELSREHISTIAKTFGDFVESDISKIFDNDDFGYRRIVVERPLRLNFQASVDRIERVKEESAFKSLALSKKKGAAGATEIERGQKLQEEILTALSKLGRDRVFKNRTDFAKALDAIFTASGCDVPGPAHKAIIGALSERDQTAEVCKDSKGRLEPDAELRDTENVPLKEDVVAYFNREVKPHVPDAWIDDTKTKVGYEIPFTRHFYRHTPLRPLAVIAGEIQALEAEIQGLLGEVLK